MADEVLILVALILEPGPGSGVEPLLERAHVLELRHGRIAARVEASPSSCRRSRIWSVTFSRCGLGSRWSAGEDLPQLVLFGAQDLGGDVVVAGAVEGEVLGSVSMRGGVEPVDRVGLSFGGVADLGAPVRSGHVQVVAGASAGERGVEVLAHHGVISEDEGAIHRRALGFVDGDGVAVGEPLLGVAVRDEHVAVLADGSDLASPVSIPTITAVSPLRMPTRRSLRNARTWSPTAKSRSPIRSPTPTSWPASVRRWRARWLSWSTWRRVGAHMSACSPFWRAVHQSVDEGVAELVERCRRCGCGRGR